MTPKKQVRPIILTAMIAVVGIASYCYGHTRDKLNLLGAPVDENTAVRFFFVSNLYFHAPLIFRVVAPKDPRLNTAPMLDEGRTAYITAPEMQSLLTGLQKTGLSWRESKEKIEFGDPMQILPYFRLVVTVVSSSGTAVSGFDRDKICLNLAPLDSTLSTPRALWEIQEFRTECECVVPGFSEQTFPQHWPWNPGYLEESAPSQKK